MRIGYSSLIFAGRRPCRPFFLDPNYHVHIEDLSSTLHIVRNGKQFRENLKISFFWKRQRRSGGRTAAKMAKNHEEICREFTQMPSKFKTAQIFLSNRINIQRAFNCK
jgi:hypothetical protein